MNEKLFEKCTQKGFVPKHAAEVGVYYPETSNILGFIKKGIRSTLVEPLPECIKAINDYFYEYSNVNLCPCAVAETTGTMELFLAESSSFATVLDTSPALLNDKYAKRDDRKLKVECKRFDEIDDGTIDLLSIDTEGSEWFVLKHMVSRPKVISIEMKSKHYVNPNYELITEWLKSNDYEKWYKDRSDMVFVKRGTFKFSIWEFISSRI